MNPLLSASSPDGSLAAIKAPSNASSSRHLIRIYQVGGAAATLQSTLTHVSKLPLVQLKFLGVSSVLGLFGRQEVVVWDLDRGVVATTVSASEEQSFLALDAPCDENMGEEKYYILVNHGPKLLVQEYLSSNNKLVRKIKSGRINSFQDVGGKLDADVSLAVNSSYVIVHSKGSGIRIMNKETGKKTGKINLDESTSSFAEASCIGISTCIGNSDVAVALENPGNAVLYNLNSCKEIARITTDSTEPQPSNLQLVAQRTIEDSFTLLYNDSLYSVLTGKNNSSPFEKLTQISSSTSAALFLKRDKVLALIREPSSEYRVQWIDFPEENGDELPAVYKLDQEQDSKGKNDAVIKKKRNSSEIKILGPGQAGSENVESAKRLKTSDDRDDDEMDASDKEDSDDDNDDTANNMTIGERLRMLTDALDEEEDNDDENVVTAAIAATAGKTKFKPQKATTESLKELLTQALQSSDDSLLELALSVHDVKIIATSIKEMNDDLLVILLGKLTSRLASSPLRAEILSVWISHCLKRGSFDSDHLAVLKNMLYERIESFSDLLRLEGRLSMMVD